MVNKRKVVVIGRIAATFLRFLGGGVDLYVKLCILYIYNSENGESKWIL